MHWLRWVWLLCAGLLLMPSIAICEPAFVCAGYESVATVPRAGKIAEPVNISPHSSLHALTVFADFAGADGFSEQIPAYSSALFDRQRVGSLAHFYATMSFGQFKLAGTVLAKRYAAPRPVVAVGQQDNRSQRGPYGEFVKALITVMDREIDFGDYDNDGPDGLPNSGDDDGVVDYLFINMRSVPRGFIHLLGSNTP